MSFALDESLDDGSWAESVGGGHSTGHSGLGHSRSSAGLFGTGLLIGSSGSLMGSNGREIAKGLAAVVVKPARVGGVEATLAVAAGAARQGVRVSGK